MRQQQAYWLVGATSVLLLATIGLLAYRLYHFSQQPSQEELAESARLSRQVSSDAAQAGVDSLRALSLPDLDGHLQSLAQWRDKVLVINYWASWCKPCIEEMPLLSRLNDKYVAQGIQFVGIGLDDPSRMQAFVKSTAVSYPLLVGGENPGSTPGLAVKALPYTVVVSRDGTVAAARYGRVDEAMLEPILNRLSVPE